MVSYTAMSAAALIAAVVLLPRTFARNYAVAAVVLAGLQLALAHLRLAGVPLLALAMSAGIAIAGVLAWNRAGSKTSVTAAAVVAACGILQVLARMKVL